MAVGWWWVYCIIITTAYRGSLISHLTVPGKTRPINTFQDLLAMDGWTWSAVDSLPTTADVEFYLGSPSPVVQEVYRRMMVRAHNFAQYLPKNGFQFQKYIKIRCFHITPLATQGWTNN